MRTAFHGKTLPTILLLSTLLLPACTQTRPPSEQDIAEARAVVGRALNSATFPGFVSCMSARNREHMQESPDARRFWAEQRQDGESLWRITAAEGLRSGQVKVETTRQITQSIDPLEFPRHVPPPTLVYFLIREDGRWVMDEMVFGH
jgi:hypothetical protein